MGAGSACPFVGDQPAGGCQVTELLDQDVRAGGAVSGRARHGAQLADEYPGMREWSSNLERLEHKTRLADLCQQALDALQSGDRRTAQMLLAQVVALESGYEQAARYLHLAVTDDDLKGRWRPTDGHIWLKKLFGWISKH